MSGTWIALAALIVSLWNFRAWYHSNQPKLAVEAKNGILPPRDGAYMIVTVRNRRPFKTQIVNVSVPIPGSDKTIFFPSLEGQMSLPCDLEAFHSTSFWVPLPELAAALFDNGIKGNAGISFLVEAGSGHTFSGDGGLLVDEWVKQAPPDSYSRLGTN